MKIRMIEDDQRSKNNRPMLDGVPSIFAGRDAPIKAARYLIQKYHITPSELKQMVK